MSETSSRSTDEQMVELQAQLVSLRQENVALQDTLDRLGVSEQSYRQLMEHEELQQRDRLLSVVAQVTKALLKAEDVDIAISAALQAVGEAAKISRVQLLLEQQDLVTQRFHHHVAYEWVAEGIRSQMSESDSAILDNEDFSFIIDTLHAGHFIWRLVDDYPNPIRAVFESLEITSSGSVPIFIEGRYIGCVAFDDCSYPRRWSPQEINVLAAAAESIGAALHRKQLIDRLVEERIQAVLEERIRFSREIHDTLAQAFTGVLMQLEVSKRKITATQFDAAQDHIARARSLALEGLSEARRSVRALRPEILESSDLPTALQHLSQQTMTNTSLRVTVRIEGTPCALPMDLEANLLRISQEAITNTLRHAQAQTIRLELLFEVEAVHLQITDDGLGFDPCLQLVNGGFGLVGMQERSQRLGGQFTLKSSHGQGTAITVTVPLERRDRLP
jgi:signal transduction histidine kinase